METPPWPSLTHAAPRAGDWPATAVEAARLPDGRRFLDGLRERLAGVENYALSECRRLDGELTSLAAENRRLHQRLARQEVPPSQPVMRCERQVSPAEPYNSSGEKSVRLSQQEVLPSPAGSGCDRLALTAHSHKPTIEKRLSVSRTSSGSGQTKPEVSSQEMRARRSMWQVRTVTEKVSGMLHHQWDRRMAYKTEGAAQLLARSELFETATLLMVVLNAIWIAIDLDLNGKPMLQSPLLFQIVENGLVLVFLFEMSVRFAAYRSKLSALYDKWFVFDATLVLMMVIETWVLSILLAVTHNDRLSGMGILSALRIMRLLRIIRVAGLCRVMPELQMIVSGMLTGVRSVLITASVLVTVTYTFAILLRQLGSSTQWGGEYFSSVPLAIYTLLVSSMLPDNLWLLDRMREECWYSAIIYFVFLLLTAVTVMNMLVGVLCDDIFRISREEKEARALDNMSERLQALLREIDSDFDGYVSRSEFESIIEHEDAVRMLADVGVDVIALAGDADFIFAQPGARLNFERFKKRVLQFRSSHVATIGSVTAARRVTQRSLEAIGERLSALEQLLHHERFHHDSESSLGPPVEI